MTAHSSGDIERTPIRQVGIHTTTTSSIYDGLSTMPKPRDEGDDLVEFRLNALEKGTGELRKDVQDGVKSELEEIRLNVQQTVSTLRLDIKDEFLKLRMERQTQFEAIRLDISLLKSKAAGWGAFWGGLSGFILGFISQLPKLVEAISAWRKTP